MMSEWISVEDELPSLRDFRDETCSIDVLICDDQEQISIGFYAIESECWCYGDGSPIDDYDVTHWALIPKAPTP